MLILAERGNGCKMRCEKEECILLLECNFNEKIYTRNITFTTISSITVNISVTNYIWRKFLVKHYDKIANSTKIRLEIFFLLISWIMKGSFYWSSKRNWRLKSKYQKFYGFNFSKVLQCVLRNREKHSRLAQIERKLF